MSTVFESKPQAGHNLADISSKLEFQKQLQAVTNKIHATSNIDEIMLELGQDICSLVGADRLTVYVTSEDRNSIVSKVKTGLTSFKDLKLPINDQSVAGFVALNRGLINIRDVYDENELRSLSPQLRFLKEVDKRTGYRTKQMLVAPVVEAGSNELIGVVQAINTRSGQPFSPLAEEGMVNLCETLAIAFKQRQKPQAVVRGKYDSLVANAVLSAEEMELALRSARRKRPGHRKRAARRVPGQAAGDRRGAVGLLRRALRALQARPHQTHGPAAQPEARLPREQPVGAAGRHQGRPDRGHTDPERVRASRIVSNIFPKSRVRSTACAPAREFVATLDRSSAARWPTPRSYRRSALRHGRGLRRGRGGAAAGNDEVSLAADNELVKLVNKVIVDAYNQGASDIHIEPYPGKGKTEIRFRKDGTLQPYISVPASYRNAIAARLKIMCDLDISEKRKPQDGKIKFKKFGPLDIELRVATIPSQGGVEDIVMRILAAGEPIPARQARFVGAQPQEPQGNRIQALRAVLRVRADRFR